MSVLHLWNWTTDSPMDTLRYMLKRMCDRCGKEIEGRYYSLKWEKVCAEAMRENHCADLCEECEEEFWKWLKGEESK